MVGWLFAVVPARSCAESGGPNGGQGWPVRMAESVMERHPVLHEKWDYTAGLVLKGIEEVWRRTGNRRYFRYIQDNIECFVGEWGGIRTYRLEEFNLDQINEGKVLFALYRETGDERYRKALFLLREQLRNHPRTSEGGFWHKEIYPHQMWLDGIYMASPFYTEFAGTFNEPGGFDDAARQITLVAEHTRDPRTGLYYHGWDESRTQTWANRETGCSPSLWGRAVGWYTMALVDVLDFLPGNHPSRRRIVGILQGLVQALAAVQDPATGLWYQVLDRGAGEGNYLEASASCMFIYAIAKGVRQGYLDRRHLATARKGYEGVLTYLVDHDERGLVNLKQVCQVAGLGGKGNRDGSFTYYISEPVVNNDLKGVGAFILASVEMGS